MVNARELWLKRIRRLHQRVHERCCLLLSRLAKRLGRHGFKIAAVAAEGGHYHSAILPYCWKRHAIFRLKAGRAHCALKDDGWRMAAHSHVDAWIVEVHLTLLRRVRKQ